MRFIVIFLIYCRILSCEIFARLSSHNTRTRLHQLYLEVNLFPYILFHLKYIQLLIKRTSITINQTVHTWMQNVTRSRQQIVQALSFSSHTYKLIVIHIVVLVLSKSSSLSRVDDVFFMALGDGSRHVTVYEATAISTGCEFPHTLVLFYMFYEHIWMWHFVYLETRENAVMILYMLRFRSELILVGFRVSGAGKMRGKFSRYFVEFSYRKKSMPKKCCVGVKNVNLLLFCDGVKIFKKLVIVFIESFRKCWGLSASIDKSLFCDCALKIHFIYYNELLLIFLIIIWNWNKLIMETFVNFFCN